nr:DUF4832 domain-containing protein [uncultured Actinoplanes sp.]
MRLLPAAAVALALLLPGTAYAATPATSTTVTYKATSDVFANPGRGFMAYTETHLGANHTPLQAVQLAQAREQDAETVVFRLFYLDRYRDVDTIAKADLAQVTRDLQAARTAGVKLVIRFAYTGEDDVDAPLARVLKHIKQLKPILIGEADVIGAIQAGFIGRWGEWYHSQNFTADPAKPDALTTLDWARRRQVVAALLAGSSSGTPVQVRTPMIKRKLYPSGNDAARLGVHDDCFLAGTDDAGTYQAADDTTWLAGQSAMLVGGETCEQSPRSDWDNASAEMAKYHWTYLNADFNTDVLNSWGADGKAETARKLGYRLQLESLTMPGTSRPGARVNGRLSITNVGWSAPVQRRPVQLILDDGTRRQTVTVNADTRAWTPGRTVEIPLSFAAPTRPGDYALALNLPDPATRLASQNSAYAIRMANQGVWDGPTGFNYLGAGLTVSRPV